MNHRYLTILLLLQGMVLFALPLSAQDMADWLGKWEGAIQVPGSQLVLSIQLDQADGAWTGTLDIPSQRVDDMTLAELFIGGDSIAFKLPEVPGNASFSGHLAADTIRGEFRQAGQTLPMAVVREDPGAAAALNAKVDRIRMLVDSFIVGAQVPGMGLGIMYKGETILADGFGYRNLEEEVPATAQTLFAIGSASKAFTSLGLGLLVDDGLLEWDEPVKTYLPDFQLYDPFATEEMTAIDLLTHRSGLPRHDFVWYFTGFDRESIYEKLRYLEPTESFRSAWQYNNLMFMTAGLLEERLSGQSWEAYTRAHIFEPLGMETANFSVDSMARMPDFAYGYQEKEEAIERMPFHNIDAIGPAGSINASVIDMLKWVQLHLGDGEFNGQHFISSGTLGKMHQPQMVMPGPLVNLPSITHPSYGLGWFIYDYDGLYVVEHGGNIDGFSAMVFLIPEQQLGMVLLTNRNGTPLPRMLAYTISDLLLDREFTDWYGLAYGDQEEEEIVEEESLEETDAAEEDNDRRVAGTHYQHELADYAGVYLHPAYGEVTVSQENDQLQVQYYSVTVSLEHFHFETFFGENEDGVVVKPTFITDANGKVVALEQVMEPMLPALRFDKQPADRLSDPAFLQIFVGEYQFGDDGPVITVELAEDHLRASIPGQPTYDLEPLDGTEFRYKQLPPTFTLEFILENDEPVAVVSHQPNGSFRAKRVEE